MEQVQPNTNLLFLRRCPLDPAYENTIDFNTPEGNAVGRKNQEDYFKSLMIYFESNVNYTREGDGVLKVHLGVSFLRNANYMMFQNDYQGNKKWFYAFVLKVEYVSNDTSRVYYKIDVMQTWYFDYILKECFVEREHSTTDKYYEHTVPEGFETGEYICNHTEFYDLHPFNACFLATDKADNSPAHGTWHGGAYSALEVLDDAHTSGEIASVVNSYNSKGKGGSFVDAYYYPAQFKSNDYQPVPAKSWKPAFNLQTLYGYKPRNNKLFTAPYNVITLTNNMGSACTLNFEDFNSGLTGYDPEFYIVGTYIGTPTVQCYPIRYKGITNAYDYGLTMNNFPKIPIASDTFQAYVARNKNQIATGISTQYLMGEKGTTANGLANIISGGVSGGVSGGMTGAMGGPLGIAGGAALGAFTSILGTSSKMVADRFMNKQQKQANIDMAMAKASDVKNIPDQIVCSANNETLNYAYNRYKFYVYQMCIKPEYAKMIDAYFDKYGYATRRIKKPNWSVRPHWTYLKTSGAIIYGDIPADVNAEICDILDSGITVWKHPEEIGNYSLDNRPV